MARPLRLERAGAWYHVTSRGIERRNIYRDDRDRQHWLDLLAQAKEMFRCRVHGYVLLPNHFHVMIETLEANLGRAMHWLNTSYTVWFNKRHERVGPLFQGRYKAIVLEEEAWGLELSRYIHLNPVRIEHLGLGKRARRADRLGVRGKPDAVKVRERIALLRRYRWSSFRAYVGWTREPDWLESRVMLGKMGGRSLAEQRKRYRVYVEEAVREGLRESPWERMLGGVILGGKEFAREIGRKVRGERREVPQMKGLVARPEWKRVVEVVEKLKGEKWNGFRDRHGDGGRDMALLLGRQECAMSLKDLGKEAGGMDYAAVNAAIKRFEKRAAREKQLAQLVKRSRKMLNVET